jgi:hypothetical protein
MIVMTFFALIHSPFVGPLTWKFVAQVLEAQNYRTIIPTLSDDPGDARPFWEQHANAAAHAINSLKLHDRCVLVGHSGAGPLLPIIGSQLKVPVVAYLFVDAGLPQPLSRLEMIRVELPERAGELEQFLKSGGLYPRWSDADLRALIPNEILRQQVLKDIRPRALPFFTEALPVPEEWDTTPCGYVQFSAGYTIPANTARAQEWPVLEFKAGHFHMMVDPSSVANVLLQLAGLLLKSL